MTRPILPAELDSASEGRRLAAVRRYDILDTPPDGAFDRITALAARLFGTPISIISLVDEDRIWFKSHHGLEVAQIDRGPGLCASAILQDDPWVLTDAKSDPRSLANPLVAGDFGLRFYAGVPLKTSDGFNLGTLCVIDREPRPITESQLDHLADLASVVMDQIELRLSARRAISGLSGMVAQKDAALRQADLMSKEIDHRVMNSLQMVSSLLALQGRAAQAGPAAEQLAQAASRVNAIGQVHRHIYLTDAVDQVEARAYLTSLCGELDGLTAATRGRIQVDVPEVGLSTRQIVPLGLIVNELVTNAAKHGSGTITVALNKRQGGYALSVDDEGSGLPADYDPAQSKGLGMRLISSLVRQLRGQLLVGHKSGGSAARVTVLFPDDPA